MKLKKIEWNLKNIYKLESLKNQKLHTTIIIMLRNIMTGKAAVGLANTFNSKIVTI